MLGLAAAQDGDRGLPSTGIFFNKFFSPSTIGPGSVSTLTFEIASELSEPATDIAFTDTLPAALTIAEPAIVSNTCGGTVTAPEGGGTITLTGGEIAAFGSCQVTVDVTGAALGEHQNVSGDLTSSAGNSGPAVATLNIAGDRPGFTKSFSPNPAQFGGTSRLTFTIDNTANDADAFNLAFSDDLPAGLAIDSPANASNSCGGTLTAPAGGDTISLVSGTVFAAAACTIAVDITAGAVGRSENRSSNLTWFISGLGSGTSGKAGDVLEVFVDELALVKDFVDDPVVPGGTVTLEFSLTNLSRSDAATDIEFTDDLDATLSGLTATGLPVGDVCGVGSQISGTSLLSMTGGSLGPSENCTFQVTLQVPAGASPGDYPNTTSNVTAQHGGDAISASGATDSLAVDVFPLLTKDLLDDAVGSGGSTDMEFTITNSSSSFQATDISFTDNLSEFITGATASALPADGFCGAGSSIVQSGDGLGNIILAVSGASLDPSASCTFMVTLDVPAGTPSNLYTNTTGQIMATVDGETQSGPGATDDLEVFGAPGLTKEFIDDPADPGGTVTLEFTLEQDEFAPAGATDIAFSDDLNAALGGLSATGLPQNDICGAGSTLSGTSTLSLTGGALSPGESCTFAVVLDVPVNADPGFHTNTTSPVTATVSGEAVTGLVASDDLLISGVELAKEFIDDPTIPGDTVTLRFTLDNDNSEFAAFDIAFTDNLDATLSGLVATGLPQSGVCGGGSEISGTSSLTFTNGSLGAGESCSFDVTVEVPSSAPSGSFLNATSTVSATMDSTGVVFPNATDVLEVNGELIGLSKTFTDDPAVPGGAVTLEFTLTNLSDTETITDIDFTDDLDAALAGLESESGLQSDICGAGSELAGTSTLAFTDGSLSPSGSCTFSAILRVPEAIAANGTPVNTTSEATGLVSGLIVSGPPASAELIINQAAFSKAFSGPGTASGTVELEFVIDNSDGVEELSGLAFVDDLDAVVPGLATTDTPLSDVCGPGSELTGTSVLTLSGGNLPAGGTCIFSVTLGIPATAAPGSHANATSDLTANGLFLADPAMDNLSIQPAPGFAKVFAPNAIALDGTSTLSFQIDNTASSLTAESLTFTDPLPAGIEVAATPNVSNTCGGTVTATAGSSTIDLAGGIVGAGDACTISVDVTGTAEGSLDNVTGPLTSSSGDSGTAADTIDVVSDEFGFSKSFRTAPVLPGGQVEMELTTVNGSTFPLTDIAFSDDLDAVIPGLVAEGLPQADPCGAGSELSGSSVISLTGGNLAGGDSCTVVVAVRVPSTAAPGSYINTTSQATAEREGLAVEAPAASGTFEVDVPEFDKQFDPEATGAGATVTLTLIIENPDPANSLTNLEFTDDLDGFIAGAIATNTPIGDACGTGSILEGASTLSLAGGRLPTGGSCTMEVLVNIPADAEPGEHTNVTSTLSGSVGGNTLTVEAASSTLAIVPAPSFTKSFSPESIAVESISTLTLVIDNSQSELPADSLAFVDNLPAGLEIAAIPAVTNDCGGTVTVTGTAGVGEGATHIEFAGGSVSAGTSCEVQVDVTTDQFGTFDNVTSDLTSSLGNSGQATATLTVDNDLDGVPGNIEDQAPNDGDGNNDGTPDRIQSDVASLPTFDGNTFMTLILTDGCDQMNNVVAVDPASQPPRPEVLFFPFGLVAFEVPCESAVIDVVFHGIQGNAGSAYWKYGPVVPGDPGTAAWYEFSDQPAGAPTGATPGGNVWTLVLADDELGDDTGNDGVIVDQGGPTMEFIAVPALSTFWLLSLLGLMVLIIALCHIFRAEFVRSIQP